MSFKDLYVSILKVFFGSIILATIVLISTGLTFGFYYAFIYLIINPVFIMIILSTIVSGLLLLLLTYKLGDLAYKETYKNGKL